MYKKKRQSIAWVWPRYLKLSKQGNVLVLWYWLLRIRNEASGCGKQIRVYGSFDMHRVCMHTLHRVCVPWSGRVCSVDRRRLHREWKGHGISCTNFSWRGSLWYSITWDKWCAKLVVVGLEPVFETSLGSLCVRSSHLCYGWLMGNGGRERKRGRKEGRGRSEGGWEEGGVGGWKMSGVGDIVYGTVSHRTSPVPAGVTGHVYVSVSIAHSLWTFLGAGQLWCVLQWTQAVPLPGEFCPSWHSQTTNFNNSYVCTLCFVWVWWLWCVWQWRKYSLYLCPVSFALTPTNHWLLFAGWWLPNVLTTRKRKWEPIQFLEWTTH